MPWWRRRPRRGGWLTEVKRTASSLSEQGQGAGTMRGGEQGRVPDTAESRGLAGLGQLPAFDLPAADGGQVRSWDYKGRRHLVLWLAGAAPDRQALAAAATRE